MLLVLQAGRVISGGRYGVCVYLCLVRLAPDIGAVADRANNLLRPSPIRRGRSERIVARAAGVAAAPSALLRTTC